MTLLLKTGYESEDAVVGVSKSGDEQRLRKRTDEATLYGRQGWNASNAENGQQNNRITTNARETQKGRTTSQCSAEPLRSKSRTWGVVSVGVSLTLTLSRFLLKVLRRQIPATAQISSAIRRQILVRAHRYSAVRKLAHAPIDCSILSPANAGSLLSLNTTASKPGRATR